MRNYLRDRDYDSFFFESIPAGSKDFDQQMMLFSGSAENSGISEKMANRIEAKRSEMYGLKLESYLPKKEVPEEEEDKPQEVIQLNQDQKNKLLSIVNVDQEKLEYMAREGVKQSPLKKLLNDKFDKFRASIKSDVEI